MSSRKIIYLTLLIFATIILIQPWIAANSASDQEKKNKTPKLLRDKFYYDTRGLENPESSSIFYFTTTGKALLLKDSVEITPSQISSEIVLFNHDSLIPQLGGDLPGLDRSRFGDSRPPSRTIRFGKYKVRNHKISIDFDKFADMPYSRDSKISLAGVVGVDKLEFQKTNGDLSSYKALPLQKSSKKTH